MRPCLLAWRIARIWLAERMPVLEWLPSYRPRVHLAHDVTTAVVLACLILPEDMVLSSTLHVPVQTSVVMSIAVPLLYALFGSSRFLCFGTEEMSSFAPWIRATYDSEIHRQAVGLVLTSLTGALLVGMGVAKLHRWIYLSRVAGGGLLAGAALNIATREMNVLLQPAITPLFAPSSLNQVVYMALAVILLAALPFLRTVMPGCDASRRAASVCRSPPRTQPRRSSLTVKVTAPKSPMTNTQYLPNKLFLGLCLCGIAVHVTFADDSELHGLERALTARMDDPMDVRHAFAYVIELAGSSVMAAFQLSANVVLSALSIYLSAAALIQHAGCATTKQTSDAAFGELRMHKELVAYGLVCLGSLAFAPLFPPVACFARSALVLKSARTQVASMLAAALVGLCAYCNLYAYVLVPAPVRAAVFLAALPAICDMTELRMLLRLDLYGDAIVWAAGCVASALGGVYYGSLTAYVLSIAQRRWQPAVVSVEAIVAAQPYAATENTQLFKVSLHAKALCFSNWERVEHALDHVTDAPGENAGGVVLDVSQLVDIHWDDECIRRIDAWERRLHMLGCYVAVAGSTKAFENALERAGILQRLAGGRSCHGCADAASAMGLHS
ncbi:hypothetical protein SDRG_10923 [Saprolegnia diclina VS20]|uniref:SLC26A/SulP transporter domain-containing protein n=1 Tax=Saprolegnia diclina (strain VS20) TaxID=1156394 RepID=T0Q9J5_SAPDV|nr:hypothetical protein SDRG_10923 [Saprolegnia diclina VS20]EQC31321.1 hypothetical protein SDRG_10923 [Saprolegnia diclina VS20]|eukprot:XP_008615162.1 hypothetical protein SDRG_10923 [Saprolegnia diclina VS20]